MNESWHVIDENCVKYTFDSSKLFQYSNRISFVA